MSEVKTKKAPAPEPPKRPEFLKCFWCGVTKPSAQVNYQDECQDCLDKFEKNS